MSSSSSFVVYAQIMGWLSDDDLSAMKSVTGTETQIWHTLLIELLWTK